MDLHPTKEGLRCALIRPGPQCVAVDSVLKKLELPVHNLDIRDLVTNKYGY